MHWLTREWGRSWDLNRGKMTSVEEQWCVSWCVWHAERAGVRASHALALEACSSSVMLTPCNLRHLLPVLLDDDKWSVLDILMVNDGFSAAEAIRKGTAILASNGSYNPISQVGTSAFLIHGPDRSSATFGVNAIPRQLEDQDPHCCELGWISRGLSMIMVICIYYNIKEGHV